MTWSVVTGAAGFVGSHLVDRLLELGHDVTGIDCFTDYYERGVKESNLASASESSRFRLIGEDLLQTDLDGLLEGADYVFHMAAQAGVRTSWGEQFEVYVTNNISATQRLLEHAKRASLRKLIFASSSSVYGEADELPVRESTLPRPVSPYGVTKLAAEHLCALYARAYGVPAVSLRLFTVYGPRQRPDMAIHRFLRATRDGSPVRVFGDGTQTRDFTFVADVVDALVRAIDATPDDLVFNVCGGSRVSVNELLSIIRDASGRELRIEYEASVPGDARHTLGDNSLARERLGFEPRVSLAEGVEREWRWLIERDS